MKKREDIITLRAIAILLVVFGHSIIIYSDSWNLYSTTVTCGFLDHLKDIINVVQMPLFFSISGFCLIYTMKKDPHISTFIVDKLRRIIVPYLIIGVFYLYPIRMLAKYEPYMHRNPLYVIFWDIILGFDNGHLWFLPTLFLMLVVTYCIGTWTKFNPAGTHNTTFYIITLAIGLVGVLIPSGIPYIGQFAQWYIYFLAGLLIHQFRHLLKRSAAIIAVLTVVVLGCFASVWLNVVSPIAIKAIALLCIVYAYYAVPDHSTTVLRHISHNSMGMYLFHSPLVYLSYCFYPDITPWLMTLINFVGFGTVSYLLTSAVRKLRLGFIIGE